MVGVATGGTIPDHRRRRHMGTIGVAATPRGMFRRRPQTGLTAVRGMQVVLMIMTKADIPRPPTTPLQGIDEGIQEMIVHRTGN